MSAGVVLLVVVWLALLLPDLIRSSSRSSPHTSVSHFARAMDVLRQDATTTTGPMTGPSQIGDDISNRQLMVPHDANRIVHRDLAQTVNEAHGDSSPARERREDPLKARRRATFQRLLGASGAGLVAAVFFGGALWALFLLSVVVLGGYAALLRHYKLQRDEARQVVRRMEAQASGRQDDDVADWARAERVAAGAEDRAADLATDDPQAARRSDDPWQPRASVRIRR